MQPNLWEWMYQQSQLGAARQHPALRGVNASSLERYYNYWEARIGPYDTIIKKKEQNA